MDGKMKIFNVKTQRRKDRKVFPVMDSPAASGIRYAGMPEDVFTTASTVELYVSASLHPNGGHFTLNIESKYDKWPDF